MNDKQVEDFIDKLNKQAAKHLVKLGVVKTGKKIYEGMKKEEGRNVKDQPNWFPKVHRMPSEWVMPDHFPDLSGYDEIAIDLETRDPGIKDTGPGYIRKNGEVVRYRCSCRRDGKDTTPLLTKHRPTWTKLLLTKWLKKQCSYENINYIFHNAFYDVGWLTAMGVDIKGKNNRHSNCGTTVDENRFRFDLNSLAKDYLKESKSEAQLYEAAKMWGLDPKGEMWKLPASHVGDTQSKTLL